MLARELLERAVALDPGYAWAWAILGWTHFADVRFGYALDPDVSLRRATEIATKAVSLADMLPTAHMLVAGLAWLNGDYDAALQGGYKAIALDPNYAAAHTFLANFTFSVGDWDATIALVKSAVRLHPHHSARYLAPMARAYAMKGDYERAIGTAEEGLRRSDSDAVTGGFLCILAFAHVEAGRVDEARTRLAEAQRLYPRTAATAGRSWLLKNPADRDRYVSALCRAALPA